MSFGDKLTLIGLTFSVVTTCCTLFIAYIALVHTTRPNIACRMLSSKSLQCGAENIYVFEVFNAGHWYASPMAVDVTVYCNFPQDFQLKEIRFGSVQEHIRNEIKIGVGGMRYLKATGLKLSRREEGEQIHVIGSNPDTAGIYSIRLTAFSANHASCTHEFSVSCGFACAPTHLA